MEQGYLIDTNAVIEYLDNKLPKEVSILMDNISPQISVITRMELLGWGNCTLQQMEILSIYTKAAFVFGLDEPIILLAIELRKYNKTKLPDAIIAATAIANNLTLITSNVSDFKNIQNLKILNPKS